jgi:prepilin-type N-terminal cleavage/methylation domain-containing protein
MIKLKNIPEHFGTPIEKGFTFLEMLLVIVILGILSTVAMRTIDNSLQRSRFESSLQEMNQLVEAMVGNPELFSGGVRTDFGYFGDIGALPTNLDALTVNPGYATWNGPYMVQDFIQDPNGYKIDAWGEAYGYSGVTITSNGGGSPITRNIASNMAELTSNTIKGVVIDGVGNPPGIEAFNVTVRVIHPDGAGGMLTRTTNPSGSGTYSFDNQIPIGNHEIQAIYSATGDTSSVYVSILPHSETIANIRLPGNLWSAGGGGGGGGGMTYVAGDGRLV